MKQITQFYLEGESPTLILSGDFPEDELLCKLLCVQDLL